MHTVHFIVYYLFVPINSYIYIYTWRDPKIPEVVKKFYLKYLYKFETLVPFEVLPLPLDAAIPAPLPILETLSKIFKENAVKGSQRFATSRKVPGSIPGGVTGDFFSVVTSEKTMYPEADSASENEYQGFLLE